ncbi:MAG: abortive infection family protein [Actinomycetota bacterium]|nr:abortive infection family protein [Actinomycetota bacterium]
MTKVAGARPQLVFTLDDALIQSVSGLVDDHAATRQPGHWDIGRVLEDSGLSDGDPNTNPADRVGKKKRVQQALRWALEHDEAAGTHAVARLVGVVKGCGGFRPGTPNYCGADAIETCIAAFSDQPVELTTDGTLRPRSLEAFAGRDLTEALRSYVDRAQKGYADSILVAGTGKDLLEAVAAHVISERFGTYSSAMNFPTLLGQAFVAVGLEAQRPKCDPGGITGARTALSVSLYELGCAVNRLRNKVGTGHGRPFLPDLTDAEVRAATEAAGLVAGRLLDALDDLQ